MFIYIGGIPSVGKSTLVQTIKIRAIQEKINTEVMNGLPILCSLANVKTAEELRRLPEEKRKVLRPRMYDIVYLLMKQKPETIWLFDGHFCYFDWYGKRYGVRPIQSWDKELMLGIIVLTAQPETILRRRIKDGRQDRKLDLDFIRKELKKETRIAQSQAKKLRKPIRFIVNEDGNAELNAKEILHLIKKWGGGSK